MKLFAIAHPVLLGVALCFLSAASTLQRRAHADAKNSCAGQLTRPEAGTPAFYIPRGRPIQVDGHVASNEWDDAATAQIKVSSAWKSPVRFKQDDQFLYFLFTGVRHGSERLFPEILLDPKLRRTDGWEKGQWWFHVSGNLCEGDGEPNVYNRGGVFQCSHQKPGWDGNNPPGPDADIIEVRISFTKVGIDPHVGRRLGLALGLTNATGDANQRWYFSPPNATIGRPATWGIAVLK
jgi:hypothetical protein